jgi:prolyl 4-hydroxylase
MITCSGHSSHLSWLLFVTAFSDMKINCAPACQTCDFLSIEGRCPIDPEAPNAWAPGDLDEMFTKLTNEPYLSKYSVQVWSSPATEGPWLITLDDVVGEEEALRLIELGSIEGYKRSADVGKLKADGTHDAIIGTGRTSTNAWCQNECYEDETAKATIYRLSNLTGIAEINSEYLQLLQYEPGQFYQTHHDYIPHHIDRYVFGQEIIVFSIL